MREDLLTLEEAAAYLGESVDWLRRRGVRGGPASIKTGRHRRYQRKDLDAFLESRKYRPKDERLEEVAAQWAPINEMTPRSGITASSMAAKDTRAARAKQTVVQLKRSSVAYGLR